MKNYDNENFIKNLPDYYDKKVTSNNYKLLEIDRRTKAKLTEELTQLELIKDIDNATGATLDFYGELIGQIRGKATDAQYRLLLKTKIERRTSNGSVNDILIALSNACDCEPSEIELVMSNRPCEINKLSLPITIVNRVGLSSAHVYQIITSLLPVGVKLHEYLLEGTFSFGSSETEYNTSAGFASVMDAGEEDIGGYLGATGNDENSTNLPI